MLKALMGEPAAIQGVVQTGLALYLGFGGTHLTAQQSVLIMAFVAAVLSVITRQMVTPNTKAGT